MHVITAKNIRDALPQAWQMLTNRGLTELTRNGPALVAPGPVTIHYLRPKEHVLIDPVRDANPFFHLMEAMWMLAGRDDGRFLDRYITDFSKNYGDIQGFILDSYGYRWRIAAGYDQLHNIIKQLKEDPTTRQAVLQMWGAGRNDDIEHNFKPCNLVATFRNVYGRLNMMVANRSNDLIWGCCGANAVHFPIMQEYVATMAGLKLGEYWQVTNNLHLYEKHIDMINRRGNLMISYVYEITQPLIDNPETFDKDLRTAMRCIDGLYDGESVDIGGIQNSFLVDVVCRMASAHYRYKHGNIPGALTDMEGVTAPDWKRAGIEWLQRRNKQ